MSNPGLLHGVSNRPIRSINGVPLRSLSHTIPSILSTAHLGYLLCSNYGEYDPYSSYKDTTWRLPLDDASGFQPGDVLQGFASSTGYTLKIEAMLSELSSFVKMYMPGIPNPLASLTVAPGGFFTLLHDYDKDTWLISGTGLS